MAYKINFKSIPEMYEKEKSDLKNNTVRLVDPKDDRFRLLEEYTQGEVMHLFVYITNTKTGASFRRWVKDVTFWEVKPDVTVCVISWRTQEEDARDSIKGEDGQ